MTSCQGFPHVATRMAGYFPRRCLQLSKSQFFLTNNYLNSLSSHFRAKKNACGPSWKVCVIAVWIWPKLECVNIFEKLPNIKFQEYLVCGSQIYIACGQTDIAKLIGVFMQLLVAKAPKIIRRIPCLIQGNNACFHILCTNICSIHRLCRQNLTLCNVVRED
jgi:hypothetical protein